MINLKSNQLKKLHLHFIKNPTYLIPILCLLVNLVHGQIITTVAGNDSAGFSGDGGKAIQAKLHSPMSVAINKAGDLFIVDLQNQRIRMVNSSGIISTIAGSSFYTGFSGDGGKATSATLSNPTGITLDTLGNIYIADWGNNRIRMVNISGTITTIAGTGSVGSVGSYSGDGGLATSANLFYPSGVAVDLNGNLFIADTYNNRIRKISTNGIITTVAGNGTYGYSGDGGIATSASMKYPYSVIVDRLGNLYISDESNNCIRKVGTNGIISTISGNGTAGYRGDGGNAASALLDHPEQLALDDLGNLYIADRGNYIVRKINTNGIISTVAGSYGNYGNSGNGDLATNATLNDVRGVAIDPKGNLYIADNFNSNIRKVSFNSLPITLSCFIASAFNKTIVLNWQTITEINARHFVIQRSTDGISFKSLSIISSVSNGTNNYQFKDYNPINGINYYRLQSVDKDGSSSYSKTVSINNDNKQSFSITPNPVKDFATISFSKTVDKATIAVYDITGKQVIIQSLNGNANSFKLNTQSLKSGFYVIKVNTATGNYNEKLLINK